MAGCKHAFEGRADGVHCKRCGIKLSPQEYAEWIGSQKPQYQTTVDKPKRSRKKVSTDE